MAIKSSCVFFARAEAFPAPISFAAPSVASQGPLEGAKRQAANFQLKTRKFFIEEGFWIASVLEPSMSIHAKRGSFLPAGALLAN